MAGRINTYDLSAELEGNYNTLNNPNRMPNDPSRPASGSNPVTPLTFGYNAKQAQRELMAEAIRAYMTNPNYLKTVAPRTAERIRDAVNGHPFLSKIIQFNGIAAAPALGGGIPQQQDNSGQ